MTPIAGIFGIVTGIIYVAVGTFTPLSIVISGIYPKICIVLLKLHRIPILGGMAFYTTIFCKNA